MTELLQGKTILITGGTSRLGRAFVLRALENQAKVFFTYHRGEAAAKALIHEGAKGFPLDLAGRAAIHDFSESLSRTVSGLDVLIHNAAATRDHLIRDMSEEDWDYVVKVGLTAPYELTKKLLPVLMKRTSPKIFFLSSRAAYHGSPGASNYAAAKSALTALIKSLAHEVGKDGVLVNGVNPGFMLSGMTEELPEAVKQRHLGLNPLGRYSDPEEVASFLCYLCSDGMKQVTGQVFHWEGRTD